MLDGETHTESVLSDEESRKNEFLESFNPEVENILSEILPSDDPLDRQEFNVIEFLNRNFPDEDALEDLEPFAAKLRGNVAELDEKLSSAVQEQSRVGAQAAKDLREAQNAVKQLFGKIGDIRAKAEQSEVMVQDICRDIKQLDFAKRHLQTTITALKRLHMLVTAVEQLDSMASERMYQPAAGLLLALEQLFAHFQDYSDVERIRALQDTVHALRNDLRDHVIADFKAVGAFADLSPAESDAVCANLAPGWQVIDALGADTRVKFVALFCEEQLRAYDKIFSVNGEAFGLEHAERRYPWFYRLIRTISPITDQVFPKSWQMHRRLCIAFCERTRAHFLKMLGAQTPDETDVTLLLKALQKTLMFEKDVAGRYEAQSELDTEDMDEEGNIVEVSGAESVRRKYRQQKREEEKKQIEMELHSSNKSLMEEINQLPSLLGIISGSFDPYMTSYVALERKNMEQMIHEVVQEEAIDRDSPLPVFSSSVNMFIYIRNSIKRCTALTRGQTFFNLHTEFKDCFRKYGHLISSKLPKAVNISTLGGEAYRLAPGQEEEVCFVINTSDYCAETLPSLEEAIRGKIDEAYTDAIDLSDEMDVFHDVAAGAMKCLVSGLEVKLEPMLASLMKLPWGNWEQVGDESSYVTDMQFTVEKYVPTLQSILSPLYFNNFCDKFAAMFLPRFLISIYKCRRINEMGTQQLLLDSYSMKTMFLQLPKLGERRENTTAGTASGIEESTTSAKAHSSTTAQVPARYVKFVSKEMLRIETVLKLIGTPTDMLMESFKMMMPEGTLEDLQQIMSVKGLRKSDQQTLLDGSGLQKRANSKPTTPRSVADSVEGKVSDMTVNLKKSMIKSLGKGNRFGFN